MKNFRLIILLCFVCVNSVFGQTLNPNHEQKKKRTVDYKTAAVFYPFAAITDNFKIGLEHRPTNTLGLRGIFTFGFGEDNFFYDASEFTGFGGELQVRYYPVHGNPSVYTGLYAGGKSINLVRDYGYFVDQNGNIIYGMQEYNATAFGFGVIGGLQFQIAKVFILDAYMGAGPNIPSGDYKAGASFGNSIWGYRRGMRYNGGLNFGVVLFK